MAPGNSLVDHGCPHTSVEMGRLWLCDHGCLYHSGSCILYAMYVFLLSVKLEAEVAFRGKRLGRGSCDLLAAQLTFHHFVFLTRASSSCIPTYIS